MASLLNQDILTERQIELENIKTEKIFNLNSTVVKKFNRIKVFELVDLIMSFYLIILFTFVMFLFFEQWVNTLTSERFLL